MSRPHDRFGPSHLGFSDESRYNVGQYRAICLVTIRAGSLQSQEEELLSLLDESDVAEFKWSKLKNAKYRWAAEKLIRFAVRRARCGELRVDVLAWDVQDHRHRIAGRDDVANLGRMHYRLCAVVMGRRWPDETTWFLYPDEQSSVDWETLDECVWKTGHRRSRQATLDNKTTSGSYGLLGLQQVSSEDSPHVQLADLFAGMAPYAREECSTILQLRAADAGQLCLGEELQPSRRDTERTTVVDCVLTEARQCRWSVEFESPMGLRTKNPDHPVNFWWYRPQSEHDKAPLRTNPSRPAGAV